MRKEFWMLLIVNGSIILYLFYKTFDLISLLGDDFHVELLTRNELRPVNYTKVLVDSGDDKDNQYKYIPDRPLLIPKIIHQTYIDENIPEKWQKTHESVLEYNPDYKYILWTDASSREFIKENYEWFLPTFDSYPYNIMRADVIRYFVLFHYGGIYIDLDNGCRQNMDPLLTVPAWLRRTEPTGVSNDLMGTMPNHPYFQKVLDNLQRFNRNWFISYTTIMFSTGPVMLSVLLKQYKRWGVPDSEKVRILEPLRNHTSPFFYQGQGSSWHQDDAKLIFMMGKHWFLVTLLGIALGLLFFYAQYKLFQLLPSFATAKRHTVRFLMRSKPLAKLFSKVFSALGINGAGDKRRGYDMINTRRRSSAPDEAPSSSAFSSSPLRSWGSSRSTSPEAVMMADLEKDGANVVTINDFDYNDEGKSLMRPRSRNDDLV